MRAQFEIVEDSAEAILIRDTGHATGCMSVTNDVEAVVAHLHAEGKLGPGKVLEYLDSEGERDQIVHDGRGVFRGFLPGAIR